MTKTMAVAVSAAVLLLLSTTTFAALFAWQYVENDRKTEKPNGTKQPFTEAPVPPDADGCPFYPTPQTISFESYPEFANLFDRLNSYLQSTLNATTRPSLSANLVYLDQVVWKGNFGSISKGTHEPPTEDTIYRIASISKTFPVLYLFKLWEEGKVDLYDPVTKYAPDFRMQTQMGSTDEINLIDIASQISGLPGSLPINPLTESAIVFNGNLEDALKLLETQVLTSKPRTTCLYSNLAYALLGHILARNFSDGNFTKWAQKNVVDPLELTNTGFTFTQDVKSRMATGYTSSGTVAPIFDLGWYGPAGNYYSTTADLAKFAMSFLETSKTILKHDTLSEMMRSRKECQHGYTGGIAALTGSPWEMNTIDENLIVRKDGDLEGYSSTMALVPSLKLAFNVVMSGMREENVARTVLQEVIPVFRNVLRSMEQQVTPTPRSEKYTGRFSYYKIQTQIIKEGPGGVLFMENPKAFGRYNTTGLSYVDEGVFRLKVLGGEFPCGNIDSQNDALVHFRDFQNGTYNTFDFPELFVYGFIRST